jgi:predicted MFS family arabinose efflux permease
MIEAPQPAPRRMWSRDFSLAIVLNLLLSVVYYLTVTSMALYAIDRFSASDAEAGFASGAFVFGAAAARLFAGPNMDLLGRRRLLVTSLMLFAVTSALYLAAESLLLLLIVRLLHGFSYGAAANTIAAAVQRLIPKGRRSEGTGYFGASTSVGGALGPLLAVGITSLVGFDALFMTMTGVAILSLVIGVALRLPGSVAPKRATRGAAGEFRVRLREIISVEALPVSLVAGLAGLSYAVILAFLVNYTLAVGLGAQAASLYYLVYAAVALASRLVVGRVQDCHGDNAVVYVLLISLSAGLSVLALMPTLTGLVLSAVLTAVGFGALVPCLQAAAVTLTPDARVGVATSTFFISMELSTGVGPIMAGAVLPHLGYASTFLVMAGVVLATIGMYWLVHGRRPEAWRSAARS